MALLSLLLLHGGRQLVLTDCDSGKTLLRLSVAVGTEFSVEFMHSINRTPVRDVYEIRTGGRIFNTQCVYYSFGTGVQTQLNEGETLRYQDGAMVISGIETDRTGMIYMIRQNSTHVLRVDDQAFFLPDLTDHDVKISVTCPWSPFR